MKKYLYNATVKSICNSNTIEVDIDLGFEVWMKSKKIKLVEMGNRPQTKTQLHATKDKLKNLLLNQEILLETIKPSLGKKTNRLFGKVFLQQNGNIINVDTNTVDAQPLQPYLL